MTCFLFLLGCEDYTEYKTINNVEYVGKVKARYDTIVQFKLPGGKVKSFYWEHGKGVPLTKGEKYNITFTVEDLFTSGDCIIDVDKSD